MKFYEASWFTSAAACQVARPLCGSDREFPSHRDFYFQASIESVALLDAGYNYDSHWNALSMGLSPIGLTSSLAARPRKLMKITWGKIATVRSGEVEFISGEFEAVHLSDPERACLSE